MKLPWLAVGIVPALTVPVLWAQTQTVGASRADGSGKLTHVQPRAAEDSDDAQSFDREAWRKRLTQSDLDARQHDFDELVDRARKDKGVHEIVESWSRDAGAGDLAWTSRLLLREADSRPHGFADKFGWNSLGGAHGWNDLQSRFDDLQRQFGGMDSMFGDLQHELDRLHHDPLLSPRIAPVPGGPGAGAQDSSQSFTLEVGPDGVECHIHEMVDGKEQSKEYKADNLEELLEAHPELRDKIGVGSQGVFGWNGSLFSGNPGAASGKQSEALKRLARPNSSAPTTEIFGIDFTKPDPAKLKDLNLEPERGLNVERTVPGTIASILGVKRGDLLIEMNGVPLFGGEDVTRVLRERAPDAEVVVTLIDGKGQRRTLTWKPSAPSADGQPTKIAPRGSKEKKDEARKP